MRISELKKYVAQLMAGGGGELDFDSVVTPPFASDGTAPGGITGPGGPQLVEPLDPTVPNMVYALVDVAEGDSALLDISLPSWEGSSMTIERTPLVGVSMLSGRIPPGALYKVAPGSVSTLLDLSEVPIQ